MTFRVAVVLFLLALTPPLWSQGDDILLRGGRVIDPRNGIDDQLDVKISGGRVVSVGRGLELDGPGTVVDAGSLLVVPGLIDLHAHVYHGVAGDHAYSNGPLALPPDGFTFRAGVTTVVDTGGSGWRDFPHFKRQVIDRSQTRVLALLNIVGSGMKGGPVEQDLADMDPKLTAMRIAAYPDILVGVKVAHYQGNEWDPVERAVAAGEVAGVPVMVDFGGHVPELSLETLLLDRLRPGDIFTHTYAHVAGRIPIVTRGGDLQDFLPRARERGIVFDVGHGAGSFLFRQAVPATRQGFYPDTISTDLHRASMNGGMKDMLNVMSKLLNLGMPLNDVVAASTSKPATVINRPELGHLGEGAPADITVLSVHTGSFGFVDSAGGRFTGSQKLQCELTIRDGRIVWDLNGLSHSDWERMH